MVHSHTIVLSLNLTFQDLHSGFSGRVSSKQSEQRQPAVVAPEPLYFEVSCGSVMFVRMFVETTVIAITACCCSLFDWCCFVLTFISHTSYLLLSYLVFRTQMSCLVWLTEERRSSVVLNSTRIQPRQTHNLNYPRIW